MAKCTKNKRAFDFAKGLIYIKRQKMQNATAFVDFVLII